MFKNISRRKIIISFSALFAIALLYLIPENKLKIKEKLEYVDSQIENSDIFLMDKNSYIAMTKTPISGKDIESKARELLKILTVGGLESKVPSGFSAIIPGQTEVLDVTYEQKILKVNFSKDILDIEKNLEEKMIEAIVYTLTSIENVDKVIIYVEGDILTKLPKTKIILPSSLDRNFGINKEFNLTSTKNITDVTIYYISQINDKYYYVPVTKYLNDDREKLDIVIEELSSNYTNKKLKSYMNDGIKIVNKNIDKDTVSLEFPKVQSEEIEEITEKTVKLSICDNYKLNNVIINKKENKCIN